MNNTCTCMNLKRCIQKTTCLERERGISDRDIHVHSNNNLLYLPSYPFILTCTTEINPTS